MLLHAISPSYGFVKASHDVIRHPRLDSDAKILIAYVQGLPQRHVGRALSDHAKCLGITGRAYQKAKRQLKENGFVHEWRRQNEAGLWVTDQIFSNVTLTAEEARRVRDAEVVVRGADFVTPATPERSARAASPQVGPSDHSPAVGHPGTRSAGGHLPVDEEHEKNSSHPPTEEPQVPQLPEPPGEIAEPGPADPQVVQAERVLLSLRHADQQLWLGVREARGLAETAADWLRRGVSAADLRLALSKGLPEDGVRFAAGFLSKRLVRMMPELPRVAEPAPVPPAPRQFIACEAQEEGAEHVFRPRGDETVCRPCRQEAAWEAHTVKWEPPPLDDGYEEPERLPWRERVAALRAADAAASG
ncbi:hypothetical protein ABZ434_25415 [Streptomyces sp. NPDC005761]|uniref:hypothetical protein n=1 Tax=unclassified Streptomyces TaxID=2593676 RepID=UPI0033FDDAC8